MVDTVGNITPSQVFPLPGYQEPISTHGGYNGGSDLMAPVGTPIVSMVSGKVVGSWTQQQMPDSGGNAVEIKGQDGLTYYYAHMLNAPSVHTGDTVVAGQQLGQVDNTGNAKTTASHLHIGIGYGISEGTGAPGGLGLNFDAVSYLKALEKNPRANNVGILNGTPNPPQISFVPSIAGFTSNHLSDIMLNMQQAIAAGVDPFLWLSIVSKESGFDPTAVNPKSGACGYAQIYPCIQLNPTQNIQEGLKRLKAFLDTCNGNVACALNSYSGGAGPDYSNDILKRLQAIKDANPWIGTITSPGQITVPGSSQDQTQTQSGGQTTTTLPPCKPIKFGAAELPDITCLITNSVSTLVKGLTDWWKQWQTEHIPNWTFVLAGITLFVLGAVSLAQSSGMVQQGEKAALKAAVVTP